MKHVFKHISRGYCEFKRTQKNFSKVMTDQSDNQFSVHPSTLGKMILIDHCFGASNQFGDSHSERFWHVSESLLGNVWRILEIFYLALWCCWFWCFEFDAKSLTHMLILQGDLWSLPASSVLFGSFLFYQFDLFFDQNIPAVIKKQWRVNSLYPQYFHHIHNIF